ncbi:GerAB/ArcD/ProY family transporter [Dehalobacterium formicoaceticum]|uniref:Endospore germination permease n=1 Tax=Dehalobacterium formicoaceticum TaxID=51515 RepID=A0ABT1Y0D6_9FIRM|nr:endospore germination permease [Dehalobacterium formicoaceticum]MCR6544323.1 endospore germination permease [Dehalobacterium formicoaceticum]
MGLEKGKVSSLGLVLLLFLFIFGSVIAIPGSTAGKDIWLARILSFMIALPLAGVFIALLNRYQGKTIIEINEIIFGPIPGGFLSGIFLWYLFHNGALVVMYYFEFIKQVLLPNTPANVLVLMMVAPCIYGAKKGLEVIVRTGQLIAPILLGTFIMLIFLAMPDIEISNIKPLFTTPLHKFLWGGVSTAALSFGETAAFLMILPFLNKKGKVKITLLSGLLLGCIVMVLSTLRTILILGDSAGLYLYPTYYAVKMIDIAEFLSRFEILIAVNYLAAGFIKTTVYLYALSLGTAQLFKLDSYHPLVLPWGFLMALFSLINLPNIIEKLDFANKAYPIYALPFILGIPLLALLGSWLKGLKGGDAQ